MLPELTPLCEACARVFGRKNAPPTPAKNQGYHKKSDLLNASQRDLEACQKDLSERGAELAARDTELA